ncbi:hypothetical protein MJG53_018949 [Ovis ammon polii x Ovis aries]|uniref:Uncharacterized protein n=1 Tax=Ovis ammon polii x Ovis aries TaxID=2918886 RepID=A0ACB9U3W2_9CETA|nr:hypothetical protein MJG53_018949 [Ovis ammon polii x Ovis aries]
MKTQRSRNSSSIHQLTTHTSFRYLHTHSLLIKRSLGHMILNTDKRFWSCLDTKEVALKPTASLMSEDSMHSCKVLHPLLGLSPQRWTMVLTNRIQKYSPCQANSRHFRQSSVTAILAFLTKSEEDNPSTQKERLQVQRVTENSVNNNSVSDETPSTLIILNNLIHWAEEISYKIHYNTSDCDPFLGRKKIPVLELSFLNYC